MNWIKSKEFLRKNIKTIKAYQAIVIGVSSGGMEAMKTLLPALPEDFGIPIVIVQHVSPHSDSQWISILDKSCHLKIKEADEKEKIEKGHVYFAPPNYHLLVENDGTFSLTIGERVSYARPSIDVLFESAAIVFRERLIGIILTGSNHDGSSGLKNIKECGGLCIVQDPDTAASSFMPSSAIASIKPDFVLALKDIVDVLIKIDKLKDFL